VIVRVLVFQLAIPDARSLKGKRMAIRSIKDRVRARLNVSVAETDHQDVWSRAEIAVAYVASDVRQADSIQEKVDRLILSNGRVQVIGVRKESL
jgi:uncharacterized protein YlxP (DUF503 family)